MKTRYLTLFTTLAFLGFSVHTFAAPPGACSPWPSCKSGDDGSDSHVHMYTVAITGDVVGSGGEWPKKNAKWIVYKDFSQDFFELDLAYFRLTSGLGGPFSGVRGENCFLAISPLFQGILEKSKGGSAKGSFWFEGLTDEESTPVLYVLKVFGLFDDSDDWPPTTSNTMTMTDWSMSVENEGKDVKSISCLGEGPFNTDVKIEVSHTDL